MEWPSTSLGLKPIEHLRVILKRKVEVRKFSDVHHLHDVAMEESRRNLVETCEALMNPRQWAQMKP